MNWQIWTSLICINWNFDSTAWNTVTLAIILIVVKSRHTVDCPVHTLCPIIIPIEHYRYAFTSCRFSNWQHILLLVSYTMIKFFKLTSWTIRGLRLTTLSTSFDCRELTGWTKRTVHWLTGVVVLVKVPFYSYSQTVRSRWRSTPRIWLIYLIINLIRYNILGRHPSPDG